MVIGGLDGLVGHATVGGWVVGVGTVVAVNGHATITLVGVECSERSVNGDLLVVDAKTVAVGVWVGKETGLKDWVSRWLNTWD